jgi:hypothetical protein
MANEIEVKQLETLIENMTSASNAFVKIYPTASLTLKYMADDLKVIAADLQGRPAALGEQRKPSTLEEANITHQEKMAAIWGG